MNVTFCLKRSLHEQNMSLYVVFMDFSKGLILFQSRTWAGSHEIRLYREFVSLVEELHTGMQTNVAMCDFSIQRNVLTSVKCKVHRASVLH